MAYSELEKERALILLEKHTRLEVSRMTGISETTIIGWQKKHKETSRSPLNNQVLKVRDYLRKKHNTLILGVKQAFDEMGCFERGRDLEKELGTDKLPSLGITDIARYIVLYT